jgi:hypothetical protein
MVLHADIDGACPGGLAILYRFQPPMLHVFRINDRRQDAGLQLDTLYFMKRVPRSSVMASPDHEEREMASILKPNRRRKQET